MDERTADFSELMDDMHHVLALSLSGSQEIGETNGGTMDASELVSKLESQSSEHKWNEAGRDKRRADLLPGFNTSMNVFLTIATCDSPATCASHPGVVVTISPSRLE
jgi:hypothetical protein